MPWEWSANQSTADPGGRADQSKAEPGGRAQGAHGEVWEKAVPGPILTLYTNQDVWISWPCFEIGAHQEWYPLPEPLLPRRQARRSSRNAQPYPCVGCPPRLSYSHTLWSFLGPVVILWDRGRDS